MTFRFPHRDEPLRISVLLLIAATYFLAGQLALLLARPPDYTMAIWPPAGIALGCLLLFGNRYWFAVLLGAALTTILARYESSGSESLLRSLSLAIGIAGGVALQAVIGTTLLRRFVESPTALMRERDVLGFFLIGGPVAHLINATWGTATLFAVGALPTTALASHWGAVWIGDSIGALLFAPLVVMWLNQDTAWISRRTVVTVPLLACFAAAILLFTYTSRSEWRQLEQHFADDASDLSLAISRRVDGDIDALYSFSAVFSVDQILDDNNNAKTESRIDAAQLTRFAAPILARHRELLAIAWAPRTPDNRSTSDPFPVRWMTSRDERTVAHVRTALATTQTSNQVAATAPIALGQTASNRGLVLTLPVYTSQATETASTVQRERQLRGYVLAVVVIPQLVSAALRDHPLTSDIAIDIDDTTAAASITSAYRSATQAESQGSATLMRAVDLDRKLSLPVANRTWRLRFSPTLDYVHTRQTPNAWWVLIGGMLFTALVGASALLVTGRAQAIETLVSQRTAELGQINEKLADEICDHLTTEHTLEKERELLRTVINNLYEGILVLDTNGQLRMANGVAYRMLHDITGENLTDLLKPKAFRMYAPDGTTELLEEQTPQYCALRGQTVSDFEMVVQTPGHEAMTLIVNAQPLLTNDRQRHGAIIVMRDITDSKAVERMKAEFVATVSHELRTPITSIRGSLGLIAGGVTGPVSEKTRNLVEIALRNSDRLAHLINDLLDMEKMESGKMQFELRRQSLPALIEQAIEANIGYAQSLNIRFVLQTPVPSMAVTVDAFRLLQVMNNLLSNAAKFSPANSVVEITVVERVGPQASRIARVQVTDRGPGVPDEFRSRIFQKFSQADSSDTRAKSGTGLGLAICKAIIEQMGGSIGYETELGLGSTFYFELPQASETQVLATAG